MQGDNYKKNDIVTVTIEDIGNDGEGIGKADGYTLFVNCLLYTSDAADD